MLLNIRLPFLTKWRYCFCKGFPIAVEGSQGLPVCSSNSSMQKKIMQQWWNDAETGKLKYFAHVG
jgi:hypothetical protein